MEEDTLDEFEPILAQEANRDGKYALRRSIEGPSLEQMAKGVSFQWYGWASYLLIGIMLLVFQDDLVDYIWLITLILLIEIKIKSISVHSRIDAILELARLEMEDRFKEETKNAEQAGADDADEAV